MTTKINGRDVWHELPEWEHKAFLKSTARRIEDMEKSQMALQEYITTGRIRAKEIHAGGGRDAARCYLDDCAAIYRKSEGGEREEVA